MPSVLTTDEVRVALSQAYQELVSQHAYRVRLTFCNGQSVSAKVINPGYDRNTFVYHDHAGACVGRVTEVAEVEFDAEATAADRERMARHAQEEGKRRMRLLAASLTDHPLFAGREGALEALAAMTDEQFQLIQDLLEEAAAERARR